MDVNILDMVEIDFDALYERAGNSFDECRVENEALFLEETGHPSTSISTKGEWVKLQFWGRDKDCYVVEVKLVLLSQSGQEIGWYSRHENEKREVVDDYLVFE